MVPGEKWTDEKLGDLDKKVDKGFADTQAEMRAGFARVDGEIKRLDENISRLNGEVNRLDGGLGELRREINARFDRIDLRFDSVNRNLQAVLVAVVVALIGSNAL